jgi:hypothetical protein
MIKNIRFWVLCTFSLINISAVIAQPRISVLGSATHNWGKIAPQIAKVDFRIVNSGSKTLHLSKPTTSCGCTLAPINKLDLEPGDTALISASVDFKDRTGGQYKEVEIRSNDPIDSTLTLKLKAEVYRDVLLEPLMGGRLSSNSVDTLFSQQFRISNSGEDTLAIFSSAFESTDLKLESISKSPGRISPGEVQTVTVSARPLHIGHLLGKLKLETSSKWVPYLSEKLSAFVKPKIDSISKLSVH